MKEYLKMLKFVKGYERYFVGAVIFMILASFFEAFQLPMIPAMIDRIFSDKPIIIPNELPQFVADFIGKINDMDNKIIFKYFPIAAVIVIISKQFFVYWYSYFMSQISQNVMRDIRDNLYHKIQHLSIDYFSKKRTGEIVSRITFDANIIENAVSYAVIDLFRQPMMILIYLGIALNIYTEGSIILLIVFPFIGIPISQIGKKLKKISIFTQEKMADITSHIMETVSGIKVVKAFNTEKYEVNRFKKENYTLYKLKMKAVRRLLLISPITEVVGLCCAMGIFMWLGNKVMDETMSAGVLITLIASFMMLISPIKKLGNVNALLQQAIAANERIYEILDAEITVLEKEGARDIPEMQEGLCLKDVHFKYAEDAEEVLRGIDLEINKGELVAIVGPTGTGKTTLVNLIPRFYDPTQGSVIMDGVDLKEVSFNSLRKQFGIVTQESILFNDTVRGNIAYGHPEIPLAEVEQAALKAFAHRFIKDMPDGYDTVIGDRGFRLSGGEKQRLSIARAILKNPPILILDEATSQLDSESEKFVQEALDKLMQGRTVVAIAHRLSTIKKANKIVVLEKGQVVGIGTHDELLESCPLYNRLHSMQFQA